MEELRPEDLEELAQELEEESEQERAERVVGDMQPLEAASLSPSELIPLNGDQFARSRTLGERVELINIEGAVHARELGEAMLAAAFLANEQAGAVHLEMSQKKVLFGLLRYDELYVVPGEHAISWPAYSFESQLRSLAGRLKSEAGKGRNRVPKIINTWLNDGCFQSPWKVVGGMVFAGLARRGLLEEHRKSASLRRLWGDSGYVLPDSTRALATQQSLEPVRQLLETCRHTRPDVWRWLIWDINSGVGSCRERGMQ